MTKNRCVRFNLRLCNAYHVRSHVIFREREIYESCACVMVRLTWHESLMLKFMLGLVLLVKTGLNKALMEGKINVQHAFQCIFCRVLHKTTTWNHQILGLTTTWAYNKEPFISVFTLTPFVFIQLLESSPVLHKANRTDGIIEKYLQWR